MAYVTIFFYFGLDEMLGQEGKRCADCLFLSLWQKYIIMREINKVMIAFFGLCDKNIFLNLVWRRCLVIAFFTLRSIKGISFKLLAINIIFKLTWKAEFN